MVCVNASFHYIVFISTFQRYSILEYIKNFFTWIIVGNSDYGKINTINYGANVNNLYIN